MGYLNEDLVFTFGLIFRILFYSTFILLMFFERARKIRIKIKKQINVIILLFAICYIGYLIPMFFDNKNHGGLPEQFIVVWSMFFFYLYFVNNYKIKLNKKQINIIILFAICYLGLSLISMFFGVNVGYRIFISIPLMVAWSVFFFCVYLVNNRKIILKLNKTQSNILVVISIIFILYCNSILNLHSYRGTWYGDFVSEKFHGILSFSLPLFAWLFINIKPKGTYFGLVILITTVIQFLFGISLSYGIDGYISDDLELSIIFILNSIIFLYAGLYNCIVSKKNNEISMN